MRHRTFRLRRLLWLAGLVAVLAFGSYAFTASLSVPNGAAAEGAGIVNGYTVGTPSYTLDAANPTLVKQVVFNVSNTVTASTAAQVSADAGTHWQSCAQGAISAGAANYTCVFAVEPTTSAVTNLEIAVAN
jgi:post-segregation antitoxin (ccd killing protein)